MSSEPAGVPACRRLQLRDTYEGREGSGWHLASPGLLILVTVTFAHAPGVGGALAVPCHATGRGPWPLMPRVRARTVARGAAALQGPCRFECAGGVQGTAAPAGIKLTPAAGTSSASASRTSSTHKHTLLCLIGRSLPLPGYPLEGGQDAAGLRDIGGPLVTPG